MSLHFNCVRLEFKPKQGVIAEHWEARLTVAARIENGEHRDVVCQRVFDRVYGDLREDFDALLALAFPNGEPAGDAGQLCRFIRLKLRGECSEPERIECARLLLALKGETNRPTVLAD